MNSVATPAASPADPDRDVWDLVWADEFEGDELDLSRWAPQFGNGFPDPVTGHWVPGWGNDERQFYTDARANLDVRDGCLVIRALREERDGCGYTSARIRTVTADGRALFDQTYGRFECRARVSAGQGLWPAFWLLPTDADYGGWAASGEIDVLEVVGGQPNEILGSLHFGSGWPHRDHRTAVYPLADGDSAERFHVYAVEWDPGCIRWLVDGVAYAQQRFWWSCSRRSDRGGLPPRDSGDLNPWPAPFDRPFHLLLNLAVGGGLPGPPDHTTAFPAEFVVDYVRVYQRRGGVRAVAARGAGEIPLVPRGQDTVFNLGVES